MSTASAQNRLEPPSGESVPLLANLTIGRASSSDLVITVAKASRRHASIHAQNGGEFWLIDLGSVNGTFLNGRRVFQPVRLQSGDKIDIAGEQFVFRQAVNTADSDDSCGTVTVATMPEIKAERCWLLVADIEEFTQLSQSLDAEDLAVTIGRWVRESRECIEKHGGVINKYLGDGYLAFWRDAPEVSAQIAAVLQESRPLQARAQPKFRLVVHVGKVLFGGSASVSEESLMGPEVNYIFRMEKVAGALGVKTMLSEAAKDALASMAPCTLVPGEHELKGFSGTHRFYALLRAHGVYLPKLSGTTALRRGMAQRQEVFFLFSGLSSGSANGATYTSLGRQAQKYEPKASGPKVRPILPWLLASDSPPSSRVRRAYSPYLLLDCGPGASPSFAPGWYR